MDLVGLIILIALVSATVIIVMVFSRIQQTKDLKARIIASFGSVPNGENINIESVVKYAKNIAYHDLRVDQITWNDLDMDSVYKRINACFSSVGEEYLYNCLHEIKFDKTELLDRENLIKFFEQNPQERFDTQFALANLGKLNYNGVASLIFRDDIKLLSQPYVYKILTAVPLVFLVVLAFNMTIGIIGIALSFLINMIFHYSAMRFVDLEIPAIRYFSSMLNCCGRLYKIDSVSKLPIMEKSWQHFNVFKKIITKAPHTAGIYLNILFLLDVRHYNDFVGLITKHNQAFHHIYKTIGEIDSALSVLSFRKSLPTFSTPQFCDKNELDFEEIYHPLIQKPITNTHKFSSNSLITGSNASGKSTFIKTLAINGIMAQTIHTCTAKRFVTRISMTITSMAMRDDLFGGESYFIVEIKSLKRVLSLVAKYPCLCYVDEILRGTNTIERIAASTAILTYLNKQDCLCVVASHDIELTRLLDYNNYHFCEQVTDNDIAFDYKLKQGATTTRNAIKLLDFVGFECEIVSHAKELVSSHD